MLERQQEDSRVARQLLGYFVNGAYKGIVQIDYRYTRTAKSSVFDIYTRIQGRDYHVTRHSFFGAIADLLDQLPVTSAVMIPHRIVILRNGKDEDTATLEEWLYPYEDRGIGDTVVYQLKLLVGDSSIETPRRTEHGYLVTDFGNAAEHLRRLLGDAIRLKICYFCRYLIEYNDYGGTDYRHDQLYCFRDSLDVLDELMKTYPILRGRESLLARGTPDMDALHSCAAFTYRETPRP